MQGIFRKSSPLYQSGYSLREISKELGIPKTTIRKSLIEGGVDLRVSNRSRAYNLPETVRPHVGVAPYGYCIIRGKLIPVPKEQEIVQLVVKLKSGGKTLSAIAAHLNNHRVKPRTAKRWDHSIIRSILNRHLNDSNQTKRGT
jgi:hypothetical protein